MPAVNGACMRTALTVTLAVVLAVGAAEAQLRVRESPATIRPPGPPPTRLRAQFTAVNEVTVDWDPAAGAQSYTVVRGLGGMRHGRTATVNWTSYVDVVGTLPPNFSINYEVTAHFADRSPAKATLAIKTADTHPVTNVTAHLEENGRKVVVTWTNAANRVIPDYLYLGAVNGGSRSQTIIPASATTITLHDLPAGTHTYAILGYYTVPGFGVVESNPETAPQFTVSVPYCVLIYQRVANPLPNPIFLDPETLRLGPGESRIFNTDWKYNLKRGTDAVRYGSHLRDAKNDGTRNIELQLSHLIGGVSSSVLKPGETKTYGADLARATCQ